MRMASLASIVALLGLSALGCGDDAFFVARPPAPAFDSVYSFANGCFVVDATDAGSDNTRYLVTTAVGDGYEFAGMDQETATRFTLRASDLGDYLLYDTDRKFLISEMSELGRTATLHSGVELLDDSYISPAEWEVTVSPQDATRLQLKNRSTGRYLTTVGTTDDPSAAAVVAFYPAEGCTPFPEMSLDAEGTVTPHSFPDGDLYGFADEHSHLLSNDGFGGAGIFHGAPFHRLGVEKALPSCDLDHGHEGRRDVVGYFYDGVASSPDVATLGSALLVGRTPEFNHNTEGYPEFTDWPNARKSSTHQTQYYKWLERSYLAGLRLVVQHATSNQVLCDLVVGIHAQPVSYSCNDMVAVEHEIDAAYAMERYIDAQNGGPGRGWFRIVTSPAQARDVIGGGKMAVILGIETSNLFDCFVTPREGFPTCDEAYVRAQLEHFHDRGVRAIFPVHKFDNAFSAGDGNRGFIELGDIINSGNYSNFTLDCDLSSPSVFDHGSVAYGGLNMPRADYFAPAPLDMSNFVGSPSNAVVPLLPLIEQPPLPGEYCQNAGLQPLGELLLTEMMKKGMIIEVDHMPRRSYARAYEMLRAADYPAAGTHGNTNNGEIYDLRGISTTGFGRCQAADRVGAMGDRLRDRIQTIRDHGGYPAEGFGFDFNGFAGAPGPRFGDEAHCSDPQTNGIAYPFTSYDGQVTFTEPQLGERTVDFNTEGMIHIGLIPELIEDARHDGVTDAELQPLFRSAEAYVRMWERAEARGAVLHGGTL